jgi:CheY-like chemotaxis protein
VEIKILLVDDEQASVEPVRAEVRERMPQTRSEVVGFEGAEEMIESYSPDIIVLDIKRDVAGSEGTPGLQTRDYIWERRFCPLVFYTAFPDLLEDDQRLKHPFVKMVRKGTGSEQAVIDCILAFESHVSALSQAGREIHWALNRALREVATRIFENTKDVAQISETLTRSARRRVAAAMDEELSTGGPNLRSWELYLCPPTSSHPLTGDVIRRRAGKSSEPSNYCVVLTPSCDLVSGQKRQPNVGKVLVGMCTNVERLLRDLNLNLSTDRQKCKDRLLSMLSQGHGRSCLPLPALPDEFPTMAVDFQRLSLINLDDIGEGEKDYVRVASVDNPFRELVAWAYMLNAARPGLPERDFASWADEIVAALPEPEKKA